VHPRDGDSKGEKRNSPLLAFRSGLALDRRLHMTLRAAPQRRATHYEVYCEGLFEGSGFAGFGESPNGDRAGCGTYWS